MFSQHSTKNRLPLSFVLLGLAILPVAVMQSANATAAPPSLELTPESASNFTGEEHTVTATVMVFGSPASGVQVSFEVSGAHSESGTDTTDSNGEATFTYTGTNIGDDTIIANATIIFPLGGEQFIPIQLRDTAEKHWSMFVIPESPVGAIAMVSASLAAVAGFMYWKSRSKGIGL